MKSTGMSIVEIPKEAKMIAVFGSTRSGKTTVLKNHISQIKQQDEAYNPLVVFPSYHKGGLSDFKEMSVDLLQHTVERFGFKEEDAIRRSFSQALKENRDIYLDEMPMCLKLDLIAKYIMASINKGIVPRLLITAQSIYDGECEHYSLSNLLHFFDCVLIGKVNDTKSIEVVEREFKLKARDVYALEDWQFIVQQMMPVMQHPKTIMENVSLSKVKVPLVVLERENKIPYISFGIAILLYCVAWIFVDVNSLAGSLANKLIAPLFGFGPMAMPHDPMQYVAIFFAWVVFFNFFIAHALEFGIKRFGMKQPQSYE